MGISSASRRMSAGFEVMAAEIGTSGDPFRAAYWRHRPSYDAGLPAGEYWGRVLDTLGACRRGQKDGRVIDRLTDADVASWTQSGRTCGQWRGFSGITTVSRRSCRPRSPK